MLWALINEKEDKLPNYLQNLSDYLFSWPHDEISISPGDEGDEVRSNFYHL